MKYRTIVADPPWPYGAGAITKTVKRDGGISVGVDVSYPTLSIDAICALALPADTNAHLYLWTTNAFMVEAHDVARAWGFEPKTILTWVKTQHGEPGRVSMKTGYYFRGATEHIIFGVRGSLRLTTAAGLPTAFFWPRLPHSVKPEAFYDLVEQASPGPYLELFARRSRLGWHGWGNEVLNHIDLNGAKT